MTGRCFAIAGAALAASIVIIGTPAHACDQRINRDCPKASDQAPAAAKSVATKQRRAARKSTAAKASDRRKRHAHARRSRHVRVARTAPRAAPMAQARQQTSAAARRFREFVNPRPIAANVIDELRKPRADNADLTASILFPSLAAELQTHPVVSAAFQQVASQDEINEMDLAAASTPARYQLASADILLRKAHAARPQASDEIVKPVAANHTPAGLTWVQLIFLTWGGVLTVASALRLVLG
jgi:hypothetical protein